MKVKQIFTPIRDKKVKQIVKQRRTAGEQGTDKPTTKEPKTNLKMQKIKSGNEWIWTTDQGLMRLQSKKAEAARLLFLFIF